MQCIYRFGGSAIAVVVSAGALILTTQPAASAEEAGASKSEDIIITSTRREADVQHVPIAVSALTEKQLQELAPRTLQDLSGEAPNVFIGMNTAGPGASAIFIRGLGYADIEKTQNPSVGVSVDGVFLGTSTGQLVDAFDISQVEVNRGPQGIFFGKNTTAGVIAVTRTAPTHKWGFAGSVAGGDYSSAVVKAVGNMPIGDSAGLKVAGTFRDRDGYYTNIFTHTDNGREQYGSGQVALDWNVNSWLKADASIDVIRETGGGSPVQYGNVLTANILSGGHPAAVFGPSYNPETGSPVGLGVRQVENNFHDKDTLNEEIYNLTFTAATPIGKVVSQSAWIDSQDNVDQDFDGTCAGSPGCRPGVNILLASATNPTGTLHTVRDQTYDQFTQEVRLTGDIGPVSYLGGVYYYHHQLALSQLTNSAVLQLSGEHNNSELVFGDVDWRVIPSVTLSGGFRYTDESKDFRTRYNIIGVGALIAPIKQSKSWSNTSSRFAASWEVTHQNLLYASRSEGFRSGGFSIRGTLSEQIAGQNNCAIATGCPTNNFLSYNPENTVAYEIGSKNTFFDKALQANLALFDTQVTDFQLGNVVVTPGYGPGTNTYIANLPKVEIKGAELELVGKPGVFVPELEGLTLRLSWGVQRGEITNGKINGQLAGIGPAAQAGAPGTFANFTGQPLQRLPDYNVTVSGQYERPLGPGKVQLNAGYTYLDKFVLGAFGTTPDIQQGYGLVDASAAYVWKNYRLSFSGKNLTDEVYRNNSLPTVFFQGYGDPLTWQVELQARF